MYPLPRGMALSYRPLDYKRQQSRKNLVECHMGWIDDAKDKVVSAVSNGIIECAASSEAVRGAAAGKTLDRWRWEHRGLAASCAGGNLLPGPAALAALVIEIPALLHVMSRGALGVGVCIGEGCDDADYEAILAVWSGALKLDDGLREALLAQIAAPTAVTLGSSTGVAAATAVAGKAGTKLVIKGATKLNGIVLSSAVMLLAGKKAAAQVGAKTAAAQISAKIISSLPARVVPIIGAGICAGVNVWFVNGIVDAAERYYAFKKGLS
jgi:hypothetical protein